MKNRSFFGAIKALLPRSRAFDITQQKPLRWFFEAISVLPDDIRKELEGVMLDYYPDTTRALDEWEKAFKVQFSTTLFTKQERRSVIGALWWLRYGNTTAEFMQRVLGLFIPGVQVTENVPRVNAIGLVFAYRSVNGNKYMCCGNKRACCNYHLGNRSWIPTILRNDTQSPWDIPSNPKWYDTYFFISRDVFREEDRKIQALQRLKVHQKWRSFLEYVVLSLKPVHSTAILFLQYVPDDEEIEYN